MFEDYLDPMATMQRLRNQNLAQAPGVPQHIKIDPLPVEQEKGLLGKIGDAALGGIGYVGGALEKLGRVVRGGLAGNPRELLNAIPFSDALGLTDVNDRVSGRDLNRMYGLADNEDTWGNFFGGLATEVATDPLMWTTFGTGALTNAGRIAQKAGILPAGARARVGGTLAEALATATPEAKAAAELAAGGAQKLAAAGGENLGGLMGFKVPFSELFGGHATPVLTGQSGLNVLDAANAAGRGLRTATEAVPLVGKPIVAGIGKVGEGLDAARRYAGALFNAKNMGFTSELGQEAAQLASKEANPYAAKYIEQALRHGEDLTRLGVTDTDEIRKLVEGVASAVNPEVRNVIQGMKGNYAEMLAEAKRLNMPISEFSDPLNQMMGYAPRHWSKIVEQGGGFGGGSTAQMLSAADSTLSKQRLPALSGFVEGTSGVNQLVKDAQAYAGSGMNKAGRAGYIRDTYLRNAQDVVAERVASGTLQTANAADELALVAKQQRVQSKDLVKMLDSLPEQYGKAAAGQLLDKAGAPISLTAFGHNPIEEMINYSKNFANARSKAIATQELMAKTFEPGVAGAAREGMVPIEKAIAAAGLSDKAGSPVFNNLIDRINQVREAAGQAPVNGLAGHVPLNVYEDIARVAKPISGPEAINPVFRGLDWLTNLFKTHVTTYWPGFNVRNFLSGQAQNVAKGGFGTLGDVGNAYRMTQGGAIEGLQEIPAIQAALQAAGRPVTAEEATKQVARWMTAHGVSGHQANMGREVLTAGGDALRMPSTLQETMSQVAGMQPKGLQTVIDTLKGVGREEGWWNPLNVAGVNTAKDTFIPAVAGRQAGDIIENMNRVPLFLDALKSGYSPAEAAAKTIGGHYTYVKETLTPFERQVMRRLVPFYSFSRQATPEVIQQILTNPGGAAGTIARLNYDLRQKVGFIPDYMGQGLAIPIGDQDATGNQRYLSRIDTPAEAAFDWLKLGGKDPIQTTLIGLLGQLNPMIKGPVEYATNKQFFTGRELGDLYSMTGNQMLDQALFNSPLARVATTVRQAIDPRKSAADFAINQLTGLKLTDVDVPKYQAIAEREYVKRMLQGNPAIGQYQTIAVRPDQVQNLTPEQMQLVQLQRLLEQRARELSKQKKAGG